MSEAPCAARRNRRRRANVTVLTETAPGALHVTAIRFHVAPRSLRARGKRRADASEQIILVKRLAQVSDNTGGERALSSAVLRIRRDQNRRNRLRGFRQAAIKLEPGHPWHLHVC